MVMGINTLTSRECRGRGEGAEVCGLGGERGVRRTCMPETPTNNEETGHTTTTTITPRSDRLTPRPTMTDGQDRVTPPPHTIQVSKDTHQTRHHSLSRNHLEVTSEQLLAIVINVIHLDCVIPRACCNPTWNTAASVRYTQKNVPMGHTVCGVPCALCSLYTVCQNVARFNHILTSS